MLYPIAFPGVQRSRLATGPPGPLAHPLSSSGRPSVVCSFPGQHNAHLVLCTPIESHSRLLLNLAELWSLMWTLPIDTTLLDVPYHQHSISYWTFPTIDNLHQLLLREPLWNIGQLGVKALPFKAPPFCPYSASRQDLKVSPQTETGIPLA